MKVLITGAAGYIGSHFVRRLVKHAPKTQIVAVDNFSEGHREALGDSSGLQCFSADIGSPGQMTDIIEGAAIDACVHFAANAYVGESQRDPFKYFDNNVIGSLNLFKVLDAAGVKRLIFSSSCATYGNPEYLPMDEAHPQRPVNVYGTTKLIIEQSLRALKEASGWSFTCLRYFNAAGADDSAEIGESHEPETHLIPLVLQTALGKREHIAVFGDDYDTRDGTCIRDYVHVNDLADAHCLALDRLMKDGPHDDGINLGTSRGSSVMEIIDMARKITDCPIEVRIQGRRPGDPPSLVASCQAASDKLGWAPSYDLESVISTAWEWEKKRAY